MKVFFDLECMSTCCWGLSKPKYEPFMTHNRGTLSMFCAFVIILQLNCELCMIAKNVVYFVLCSSITESRKTRGTEKDQFLQTK